MIKVLESNIRTILSSQARVCVTEITLYYAHVDDPSSLLMQCYNY